MHTVSMNSASPPESRGFSPRGLTNGMGRLPHRKHCLGTRDTYAPLVTPLNPPLARGDDSKCLLRLSEPSPANVNIDEERVPLKCYRNRHVDLEKMPETGIEPARPYGHKHLKLARLPIPPPGQRGTGAGKFIRSIGRVNGIDVARRRTSRHPTTPE
jgi:hypothetical protein